MNTSSTTLIPYQTQKSIFPNSNLHSPISTATMILSSSVPRPLRRSHHLHVPSAVASPSPPSFLKSPHRTSILRFRIRRTSSFRALSVTAGTGDLIRDAGASSAVLAGAYALVSSFDYLTQRNLMPQKLSRKLVHITSGLLYAISWPIFSNSIGARYFASLVPLVNGLRLVVYGLSIVNDEGLIKSVTRDGNPKELLRGPLYYVVILIFSSLVFWRDSPVGLIALAMMCGGDGIADIIGRKFGSQKLPHNPNKSWAGSISMFIFGFLISVGILYYYSVMEYFQLDWTSTIQKVALVSLVATLVESLPATEVVDDNISVPLASMVAAYLVF